MAKKDEKISVIDANVEGRDKAIAEAIRQIDKKYGEGAIMRLGSAPLKEVDVIPTGALSVDIALGIGGIPRGRVTEIYGPESSGKTTVSLHIIAEAQKRGGEVAFIDAEHALDPVYARKLGVDVDKLIVSQPDSGEDALEICEALARSNAFDLIVIDSVAALVPKAEIAGLMGDSFVGLHARLMSQALRKLTPILSRSNTAAVFINQIREKVGVMYGNPEVTTGGRALKFYSSIRIEVRRGEPIKVGDQKIGNLTKVKIVKNKMAPPFKEAEFDVIYGEGISKEGCVIDAAVAYDVIQKSGSWFSYDGNRIGQGKEKVKLYLKEHEGLIDEISNKVIAAHKEAMEKQRQANKYAEKTVEKEEEAKPEEIYDGGDE
ncbi:MAG: recombinase RecA [Clostridia bacterium]|nr:recombinase RecA [Oscillospiraceae bacterium]MDY5627421.1 recombinase RecA [Clostridia bacterium]